MTISADIAELLADPEGPASQCVLEIANADEKTGMETRTVRMITSAAYGSALDPRNTLLSWANLGNLPQGADWGYGLLLSADAPIDMEPTTNFTIIDGTGARWRVEMAKPMHDTDIEGSLYIVAWRLALRGTQRAIRGR